MTDTEWDTILGGQPAHVSRYDATLPEGEPPFEGDSPTDPLDHGLPPDRPFRDERMHREPTADGEKWWRCAPLGELRRAEERAFEEGRTASVLREHPGEAHTYRVACTVCGEPGTVRVSIEP